MKKIILTMMTIFAISLFFMGCKGKQTEPKQEKKAPAKKTEAKKTDAKKKKVTMVYVEWSSEIASTNVVKAVLQEKMGYQVDMKAVDAGVMYKAVSTGDADAMVAAWLPTLQKSYIDAVKDKVEDLGANLEGTKSGLVVPEYVTINSIDEMNAQADKFDGKIIGIDAGAGIMKTTEKVIKDYKLDKLKLISSSGAAMTKTLADAIKDKKWCVVTGWTPHWKFAKWKLKYLKDPKNLYGGAELIKTIVRKGLKKDMPEVYQFLDNFKWSPDDMAELMIWNTEKGADPYKNAVKWINAHQDKVNKWLAK